MKSGQKLYKTVHNTDNIKVIWVMSIPKGQNIDKILEMYLYVLDSPIESELIDKFFKRRASSNSYSDVILRFLSF